VVSNLRGERLSSGFYDDSFDQMVPRQMNKVCIVGCRGLSINLKERTCSFDGKVLREGDRISLDGNTGSVYEGEAEVTLERPTVLLDSVEGWRAQDVTLT
jgi:pyruvate,orthophosphate dikinase